MFLRVGDGHELGDHYQLKQRLREKIEGKPRDSANELEAKQLIPVKNQTLFNLGKELQNKVLDEYSVSEKHEGGCCQNIIAMIQKRCILFRRQYTYLLLEAFVPVLFVLIGLLILQVSLLFDSPARVIETKMYPLP